jgi:uncharacterized protein with beta-barrel porin domain
MSDESQTCMRLRRAWPTIAVGCLAVTALSQESHAQAVDAAAVRFVPGQNTAQADMALSIDRVCPNIQDSPDPVTQELAGVCTNMAANALEISPNPDSPLTGVVPSDEFPGYGLDAEAFNNALQSINGEEIQAAQSRVGEVRSVQVQNVASRLQAVRTGQAGPGIAISGLSFEADERAYAFNGSRFGHLDEVEILPAQWLDDETWSKLGIFVTGGVKLGDKDSTGEADGFDFTTLGLTAGADYRLSDRLVVGAALGYSNFDADFDATASSPEGEGLESDSVLISAFTSYSLDQGLFIDGIATLGFDAYDSTRRIVIPSNNAGAPAVDETAEGDFDAFHYGVAANVGYDIPFGGFTLTPIGRAEYIKAEIDGFTETGAGALNLTFGDQDAESLTTNLGAEASYALSTEAGVITPAVRAEWVHEFANDNSGVSIIYAADDSELRRSLFNVSTESVDRDYGIVGASVAVAATDGWSAFVDYSTVVALSDFDIHNVSVGFRKEF